jgi:signal transduction histidine kinase
MAATVAHEVKNPLSSIKSIAQVMREDGALGGYDRDLELIVSEIDRLNRTVSQLLAFSRPSNADPRPVPLYDLVDSTVALLGNEARDRGVKVTAEMEGEVMLNGAQAAALREALSNLVVNAIQASSRGGEVIVEAKIETAGKPIAQAVPEPVSLAASNSVGRKVLAESASSDSRRTLILSVTDQGSGIPEETRHKIFEPFYTTKSRGTGLGLAIVQRRVAELGGLVEVISPTANNHGTRFRLVVPYNNSQGE